MSDEPIEFTLTRSRADYVEALRANAFRSGWALTLTPLAMLVLLLAPLLSAGRPLAVQDVVIPLGVAIGFALVYFACLWLLILFAAQRSWRQPGGEGPLTYRLTKERLGVRNATGFSEEAWSMWRRWFETPGQIVLRHRLGVIQILPKRGMSAEVLGRVRALLTEAIPAKGRAR